MTDITCEVQYVHFAWHERQVEGVLKLDQALRRFRSFPFDAQLAEASKLSAPTFPTIAFRTARGDSLAIWCESPHGYDVHAEVEGRRWTSRVRGSEVEHLIAGFYRGDWSETTANLGDISVAASFEVAAHGSATQEHKVGLGERIWIIGASLVVGVLSFSLLVALLLPGSGPSVREGVVARFGGHAELAGGICALAAVGMGFQWVRGWAKGYMYYGPTERIYIDASRKLFGFMAAAQALLVLVFGWLALLIMSG